MRSKVGEMRTDGSTDQDLDGSTSPFLLLPTTSSVFRLPFRHESFRANVLRMLGIMSAACLMGTAACL